MRVNTKISQSTLQATTVSPLDGSILLRSYNLFSCVFSIVTHVRDQPYPLMQSRLITVPDVFSFIQVALFLATQCQLACKILLFFACVRACCCCCCNTGRDNDVGQLLLLLFLLILFSFFFETTIYYKTFECYQLIRANCLECRWCVTFPRDDYRPSIIISEKRKNNKKLLKHIFFFFFFSLPFIIN